VAYSLAADRQTRCQLSSIQHLALVVRQHLPETVKDLGWNTWTE
jgi:hypothetical protein